MGVKRDTAKLPPYLHDHRICLQLPPKCLHGIAFYRCKSSLPPFFGVVYRCCGSGGVEFAFVLSGASLSSPIALESSHYQPKINVELYLA